jgi:hypothetical protein
MTPAATTPSTRRLVLVPVADRSDEVVRRYRLARLSLEPRDKRELSERFAHLKRTYD